MGITQALAHQISNKVDCIVWDPLTIIVLVCGPPLDCVVQ